MGSTGSETCPYCNIDWLNMSHLITVYRDEPVHPDGPTTADLHPDEVTAWLQLGWRVINTGEVLNVPPVENNEDEMKPKPKPKPKPKGLQQLIQDVRATKYQEAERQ